MSFRNMLQSLLMLAMLTFVCTNNSRAQSRDIGAHSLLLDDGAGHVMRISVPPGGWGESGIYDWVLPIPPAGIDAGFVQKGTTENTSLEWNDAGKYWMAVPNAGAVGTGTANTLAMWDVGGLTLTNSGVIDNGSTISSSDHALLFSGSVGPTPASGPGVRMMWIPGKAAFRSGEVTGSQWDDENVGPYSVGMGYNALASGYNSFAAGNEVLALGSGATAFGLSTQATNEATFASGMQTTSSGFASIAGGYLSTAGGNYSNSHGAQTHAIGEASIALGADITASGDYSVALGAVLTASNSSSIAIGRSTSSTGISSVAIGESNTSSNLRAISVGYLANASGPYSMALGRSVSASGASSLAMGQNTTAGGANASAFGTNTTASGANSTAMGSKASTNGKSGSFIYSDNSSFLEANNTANNEFFVRATGGVRVISHLDGTVPEFSLIDGSMLLSGAIGPTPASGAGTRMMWVPSKRAFRAGEAFGGEWDAGNIGAWSSAIGAGTIASGDFAMAVGGYSEASGFYSFAAGYSTEASGGYSTAIGNSTSATGSSSFAAGGSTIASNYNATAFGAATTASGEASTAMGGSTVASANYAIASGYESIASGELSFALGLQSTASAYASIAGGRYSEATGENSIALGFHNTASGVVSVALGSYASTNGMEGSFVYGDGSAGGVMNASAPNQFTVRAAGGTRFFSNAAMDVGVELSADANSWSSISDSNRKENRLNIDGIAVLNKISNIWLGSWNYKGQDKKIFRHYGPMAQEFYAAFGNDGVGISGNDTTLASADVAGVSLIAIKALIERSERHASELVKLKLENTQLRVQNATLIERLDNIESAVTVLAKVSAVNSTVTVSTK